MTTRRLAARFALTCLAVLWVFGVKAERACANAESATKGDLWVERALPAARETLEVTWLGGPFGSDATSSPAADFIAYSERSANVTRDTSSLRLLLARWRGGEDSAIDAPQVLATSESKDPYLEFNPTFSRNGQYLAHRVINESSQMSDSGSVSSAVTVLRLRDNKKTVIDVRSMPAELLGANFTAPAILQFSLSANGERLGLIIAGAPVEDASKGREVSVNDFYWGLNTKPVPARLVVVDLATGKWAAVGPSDIDVIDFDWSPDGKRIAFSGIRDIKPWQTMFIHLLTDIYLLDLASSEVKTIVSQPGPDAGPTWSPDGKWIAFKSQRGDVHWVGGSRIGLYHVSTGALTYPAFDELGKMSGFGCGHRLKWSPDSGSLVFNAPYHLSEQLFRLSVPGGKLSQLTKDTDASNYLPLAAAERSLLFIKQSHFSPPEIYVASTASFRPIRLTNSNPTTANGVRIEHLSWPSTDGKWTVNGWFFAPNSSVGAPPPLLVYAEGGPDMIDAAFLTGGSHYPLQAFLAAGVAVLIPNSRGRAGYGTAFEAAWETEHNPGKGPLEDDLAGIDEVVKRNLADGTRVALGGHSWGGYLAGYALTHTQRFKAVLLDEGVELDSVNVSLPIANQIAVREFARQQGFVNPFEPGGLDHLRSISPLYEVQNASTPVLLEFGMQSGNIKDAMGFFQGLKYFNKAPAELVVYPKSSHVTTDLHLRMEAAARDLEWFAYWVLGKPTQRMLEKYGPPKISEWNPDAGARAETLH